MSRRRTSAPNSPAGRPGQAGRLILGGAGRLILRGRAAGKPLAPAGAGGQRLLAIWW
jgi:hypothetical protein